MTTQTYINRFFEEKVIPFQLFTIEDKTGMTHFIDTDVVIESIKNTSNSEQTKIANVLRQIDYKNGSIVHFLKFLAHGLVKQYAEAA